MQKNGSCECYTVILYFWIIIIINALISTF